MNKTEDLPVKNVFSDDLFHKAKARIFLALFDVKSLCKCNTNLSKLLRCLNKDYN